MTGECYRADDDSERRPQSVEYSGLAAQTELRCYYYKRFAMT